MIALFSKDKDIFIFWYDKLNMSLIKKDIRAHIDQNPYDELELCKEYQRNSIKRFFGMQIIKTYNRDNF